MKGATNQNQPSLAGYTPKDFSSHQRAVPTPYFAGIRRLEAKWITDAGDYKKVQTSTPLFGTMPDWMAKSIGFSYAGAFDPFPSAVNKASQKGGTTYTYYYASIAAELACERLDFIYGILSGGGVLWPTSSHLNGNIYLGGKYVLFVDGNVYFTPTPTRRAPPESPWVLVNHAPDVTWGMPTYTTGACVIYLGRIWECNVASTTNPPSYSADWILFKRERGSLPNPYHISFANHFGDGYLYWGTPTQTLGGGETFLTKLGHPPVRWRSTLVLQKFLFGQQKTAPQLEVLGGRAPQQAIITGASADLDADWQANPWTVISELLTHQVIGMGMPASLIDSTSFQAEADRCAAIADRTYISPFLDSQEKGRAALPKLLEYVDSFVFWGNDGKLHAGHWPHGEAVPGGLIEITTNDLTKELDWRSGNLLDTNDSVDLSFTNLYAGFSSDMVTVPNLLNRQMTRRASTLSVDRSFIVRPKQAFYWAVEAARTSGMQKFTATIEVRAEKASSISAGTIFELTDDLNSVTELVRCVTKNILAPPSGLVQLTIEKERGYADVAYHPTPALPSPLDKPLPGRPTDYQIVQIPDSLAADGGNFRASILCARTDDLTKAIDLWWNNADPLGAMSQLTTIKSFALYSTLNGTSNASDVSAEQPTTNSVQGSEYNLANGDLWNLSLEWKQPAHSGKIKLPSNPANNATLVLAINGTNITFTAVNTIGAVAGNCKRDSSDPSIFVANLLDLLQNPSSTTANHVALSAPNQALVSKFAWAIGQLATTISGKADGTVTSFTAPTIPAGTGNSFLATDTFQTTATEGQDYSVDYINGTVSISTGGEIPDGSTVQVAYSIYITVAMAAYTTDDDIESVSGMPTADEVANGKNLLFVFQSANATKYEIMSIKSVTALGGGVYQCAVRRGMFGTLFGGDGATVFTTSDRAFFAARASVLPINHQSFADVSAAASTATFRLVPSTAWEAADVTDVYDAITNPNGLTTEFTYTFFNPYQPQLEWVELQQNGTDIASFAVTFSTDDWFDFTVALSAITNMATFTLLATQGSATLQILTTTLSGASQSVYPHFQLPEGTWQLIGIVGDLQGNTFQYPLTQVGSSTVVAMTVTVGGAAPTKVATPTFSVSKQFGMWKTTISDTTAGAVIRYKTLPLGSPNLTSVPWKTYTSPLLTGDVTIYSYAYDPTAVLLNSAVAKKNV